MTDSAINFLRSIARELQTQDNACTSMPIPTVVHRHAVTGIDADCADDFAWFEHDSGRIHILDTPDTDPEVTAMEAKWREDGTEPDGWTRTGIVQRTETVQAFLTTKAAHAFIARRAHDYRGDLQVYIESAYRNPEMAEVRRLMCGPLLACVEALDDLLITIENPERTAKQSVDAADAGRRALAVLDSFQDPHK